MATISTCDRCRRTLTAMTRWLKLKPAIVITNASTGPATQSKEPDIDLCGDCYDSVMSGFKSFADAGKAK